MDTFKKWCSWTLTDWLRELNTAFIPFIPWQFVIYTTETDYAIKQQDLKGSIRQRSLQIYLASGELGSLKTFLAAFSLIPLNHFLWLWKLESEMRPWIKWWKERMHQRPFFGLVWLLLSHFILYSLWHSCFWGAIIQCRHTTDAQNTL